MDKHFTIEFEYADFVEVVDTDLLIFIGIHHNGERPHYITVTCNKPSEHYYATPQTKECVRGLMNTLSLTTSKGHDRIRLKPLWFHKAVVNA